jgi:hypothetical protein
MNVKSGNMLVDVPCDDGGGGSSAKRSGDRARDEPAASRPAHRPYALLLLAIGNAKVTGGRRWIVEPRPVAEVRELALAERRVRGGIADVFFSQRHAVAVRVSPGVRPIDALIPGVARPRFAAVQAESERRRGHARRLVVAEARVGQRAGSTSAAAFATLAA